MFTTRKSPHIGPTGDVLEVADDERSVSLQRASNMVGRLGKTFILRWQGRTIPFDVTMQLVKARDPNDSYTIQRFTAFGGSVFVKEFGIPPYNFKDDDERHHATMLAIEALIAYGNYYDGDRHPDRYFQVEYGDRLCAKT